MELPYPRDTKEAPIGVLEPLVPTPSIDGPVFTSIAWALWGVALIMVISRIVDTQRRSKKYGIEAWFSIGSFVLLSLALTFAMISFKEGLDYVLTFVVREKEGQTRRNHIHRIMCISSTIFTVLYPVTLWVSKAAILFASRVLILSLPQYHAMFWLIVALEVVFFMVYFVLLFAPYNISILWTTFDYPVLQERSYTLRTVYIIQVVLDVITDLLAMVLPCRLLPGLKIAMWKKIMAIVVFTLGVIIIIFASLRIAVLLRAFHAQFPAVQASVQVLTWSQLQLAMSSIVANAPALRNLIQYKINEFHEKRRRASTKKNGRKGRSRGGNGDDMGAVRGRSDSDPNKGVRRKRDSFEKLGIGLVSMNNHRLSSSSFSSSSSSPLHQLPSVPLSPSLFPHNSGVVNFEQHSSTTLLGAATMGEPQAIELEYMLSRLSSSTPTRPSSTFTTAHLNGAAAAAVTAGGGGGGGEGTSPTGFGIELAQWPSSSTSIAPPSPFTSEPDTMRVLGGGGSFRSVGHVSGVRAGSQ